MFPACRFRAPNGTFQKASFTALVVAVFVVYVMHTSWLLYGFIYTKPCEISKNSDCIGSYLAEKPRLQLSVYTSLQGNLDGEHSLVLKVDDFDVSATFERQVNVSLPGKSLSNGTVYALVFVHRAGMPIKQDLQQVRHVAQLTTRMLAKPPDTTHASEPESLQNHPQEAKSMLLWRSRLILHIMSEDFAFERTAVPSDLRRYLRVYENGKEKVYLPLLFVDELANRMKDMMEITTSSTELPLSVSYSDISLWKLRLWTHIQDAVYSLHQFGYSERDVDEIKSIFVGTNMCYLVLTGFVASVHAMNRLSCFLYLLCLGASIYSLLFMTNKSLYSWLVSSLVNGVYTAAFLSMLPHLYVNYKLKSVAHVSQKTLAYNVFRSSVNSAFAIIVAMPTAHRLACFRNSVVFLIYLHQRWIYSTDEARRDEYRTLLYEKPECQLGED